MKFSKLILFSAILTAFSVVSYAQVDADIFTKVKTAAGTTNYSALQLKTYIAAGVGSVSNVSIDSSLGLAGVVLNPTTTPVLRLKALSSYTGVLKSINGTVLTAVAGIDYSPSTAANASGLVKSTTATGALATAIAGTDYVIPSGSITGNAATVTTNANLTGQVTSVGNATTIAAATVTNANLVNSTTTANGVVLTLGASNPTAFTLQNVTTAGATSTVATTYSGGLTASTGGFTSTGTATLASLVNTEGAAITATSTLPITGSNFTINNAAAVTITIPTGLPVGYVYYVKVADTAVGIITLSSTEKVFNSALTSGTISNGAGLSYTIVKGLTYWTVN